MSNQIENFIDYLINLKKDKNRCALAILKRSLGFQPGTYHPSYPYVEPFISSDMDVCNPYRKALYLVAGLFAKHPHHFEDKTFASVFGAIANESKKESKKESFEKRFITLLGAESDTLPTYLRQAISLIGAEGEMGIDFVRLTKDIFKWSVNKDKQKLKIKWARDFYRAYKLSKSEQLTNKN